MTKEETLLLKQLARLTCMQSAVLMAMCESLEFKDKESILESMFDSVQLTHRAIKGIPDPSQIRSKS